VNPLVLNYIVCGLSEIWEDLKARQRAYWADFALRHDVYRRRKVLAGLARAARLKEQAIRRQLEAPVPATWRPEVFLFVVEQAMELVRQQEGKPKVRVSREVQRIRKARFKEANPEKFKAMKAAWRKRRWLQRRPEDRLLMAARRRLRDVVKGERKAEGGSTRQLLGVSGAGLKEHLEKQFKPGMTWENYGVFGWHVDHIKPCASFDFSDLEQLKQCFHYSNLQPLWAEENVRKGASIT
jgi:hypothetical protein